MSLNIGDEGDDGDAHPSTFPCANFLSDAGILEDFLLMTHKYRGYIVVLSINRSVEPNEEQKVLTSGFDQEFTINTSKRVFRGIW
jgi:hypothetical protein